MANSNAVTISVKEYDIESISRAVPGQISHLGITFSFNPPKEVNFGSFTNGKYNPVGGLFNPFDVVDGFIGQLGMPSSIAAQVSVTQEYAEALYDQVQAFANDLAKAGIGYSLIAVNSNSAAALAMAILGIDPKGTSFKGWPVGINIDLAGIKGIKTPAEYRKIAMEIYQQKVIDKMGVPVPTARPECFLAGTMIDMWPLDLKPDASGHYDEKVVLAKIWQKPIEEVTPDDWVVSYDDNGRLKPGRVTRTFQNHSKHILDVHGLMMTPGHVTYCAKVKGEENRFAGRHVPVMDILRSDGALKKNDGTLIRAATGCEVGSEDDKQFWAHIFDKDSDGSMREREKCQLRLGTRWMMPNGESFTMRQYMDSIGVKVIEEGKFKGYTCLKGIGAVTGFEWKFSDTLPKPEDYVLQRSQVTLEEIYSANEWEAVRPQSPAPFMGEVGHSYKQGNTLYAGSASDHLPPNIPHSMRNSPNQPTMSRQQRRALERKQKKAEKRSAITVH